ncbi:hypothetical protein [uncultured Serinicoccus sp.]|uniref:hypothetical protein n=1 Tax=uncultured Serinicoccus sp. TaxID=735514 RepID=UPI00260633F7|nr:hypothetical protein [uncultured Serinicoccus sp.]
MPPQQPDGGHRVDGGHAGGHQVLDDPQGGRPQTPVDHEGHLLGRWGCLRVVRQAYLHPHPAVLQQGEHLREHARGRRRLAQHEEDERPVVGAGVGHTSSSGDGRVQPRGRT